MHLSNVYVKIYLEIKNKDNHMKEKKVFVCTECDHQSPKWVGRCPGCGKWNTLVEETYTPPVQQKNQRSVLITDNCEPVLFNEMEMPEYIRSNTGIGELDRVSGGGIVDGSVVLLAGEPGIGKSTLLMQICSKIPSRILYVSGEESKGQLKLRGQRLGIEGEDTYFMTETNVDKILESTDKLKPRIVIIDSIQTMIP